MNLYIEAARIIQLIDDKKGSIKSFVYSSKFPNIRQLYALICETLKYKTVLQTLVQKCQLSKDNAFQDKTFLPVVVLYEYLLGQGLKNAGIYKKPIMKREKLIETECESLLKKKQATSLEELISKDVVAKTSYTTSLPRYVRVNLLITSVTEVLKVFQDEGWIHNKYSEDIGSLKEDEFMVDPFLPDVLIFPPGTEFHEHHLYDSGSIVLQDRASCFPAHILSAPENSIVIDCCAAPGNKTSHVASLMRNTGKIFAFDRDRLRLNTMKSQLVRLGVENTELFGRDFLSVKPDDPEFSAAEYILVDPSCSGSGIVTRLDYLTENSSSKQRLRSLSNFQASLLKHALKFPNAKRIVYSTCSLHPEENEEVVEDVLSQFQEEFTLKKIVPDWPMRGWSDYCYGDAMIRMCPEEHYSNGFFVACFERTARGDNSEDVKGEHLEYSIQGNDLRVGKKDVYGNKETFANDDKTTQISDDTNTIRDQNYDDLIQEKSSKKKKKNKHKEKNESQQDGQDSRKEKRKSGKTEESFETNKPDEESHSSRKKKKKKHKLENESSEENILVNTEKDEENNLRKKKKEKKLKTDDENVEQELENDKVENTSTDKQKKKYATQTRTNVYEEETQVKSCEENNSCKKKKKKHKLENENCGEQISSTFYEDAENGFNKKKKKHKLENKDIEIEESEISKKRKKNKKNELENENSEEQRSVICDEEEDNGINKKKKKKKKHKLKNENTEELTPREVDDDSCVRKKKKKSKHENIFNSPLLNEQKKKECENQRQFDESSKLVPSCEETSSKKMKKKKHKS